MPLVIANLIADTYAFLHAESETDAVFVDDDSLEALYKDRLKRLAQQTAILVERDVTSIALATGTATYALPARHLSTIHVALSNRPLIASSRHDLERRDSAYQTQAATVASPVRRWYEDKGGFNRIGFSPVPSAAQGNGLNPEILYHAYPCNLSEEIDCPTVVGDVLMFQVVGESYERESDFRMPEVAQIAKALVGFLQPRLENLVGMSQ